jgi:hypothetical protein
VATCSLDGSNIVLGPRNVSHRVAPTLLADGRVVLTEWRHLGATNEGDLTIINQDLTGTREGFGRENKGLTNSYLRAREISPGKLVAIGTSRDRTYQAGKILVIDLGGPDVSTQSEARSSAIDLTPEVPGDRTPSYPGTGRYYDAVPIGDAAKQQFLVSWSDGYVESGIDSMAKSPPDFGIYVYDAKARTRSPVVNNVGTWETSPIAIAKRPEPNVLAGSFLPDTQSTLISAISVYDSTMFPQLVPGSIKKARITEGFSSEEGFRNSFGLTEFDGQARLGEVDVTSDGEFKALVPANVPIRIQLIDKYGLAAATAGAPGGSNASEPIWIQGRAGESKVCGGCHESRTEVIRITPGSLQLQATGAAPIDYPGLTRQQRLSLDFSPAKVMGLPWKPIQDIFNAHCIDCHEGTPGAANPSYTLTDVTDMTTFQHTFDLTDKPVQLKFGMDQMYTYETSYVTMLGPSMALREKQVMVTMGQVKEYVTPGSAYESVVIQRLNPPSQYPFDDKDRAFPGKPIHPADVGMYGSFNGADPKYQLKPEEYFLLGMMCDNGGQHDSRESLAMGGK